MKTKNQDFLEELNKAFARSDIDFILKHVTDNIKWTILGDFTVEGKDQFTEVLKKMESEEPYEISLTHIITHGKQAAVDGIMTSTEGKKYAFCDIYNLSGFKNPKVAEITTYILEIK